MEFEHVSSTPLLPIIFAHSLNAPAFWFQLYISGSVYNDIYIIHFHD